MGVVLDPMEDEYLRDLYEKGSTMAVSGTLLTLLEEKFGPLPEWAKAKLTSASLAQLDSWTKRLLRATSLNSVLE